MLEAWWERMENSEMWRTGRSLFCRNALIACAIACLLTIGCAADTEDTTDTSAEEATSETVDDTADSSETSDTDESWQVQYDLGMQYLEEEDYEQAVEAFTAAIEIDESVAGAYIQRAGAYLALGTEEQLRAAMLDYETAVSLGAASIEVFINEAEIFVQLGDEPSAIDYYLAAIAFGATEEDVYARAAQICIQASELDRAQEILEEGLALYPDSVVLALLSDEIPLSAGQAEYVGEDNVWKEKIESVWWDELMRFVTLLEEDPDSITSREVWLDDELYSYLCEEPEETLIWELESGTSLAIYPGGPIFYGTMEDGERIFGIWTGAALDMDNYDFYMILYNGPWENDLPNGNGNYTVVQDMSSALEGEGAYDKVIQRFNINFINGLADGTGTAQVTIDGMETDEESYEIEASEGYLGLIYTDLNGDARALVVTTEGGTHWWWYYRTSLFVENAYEVAEE